jgi:hypothetical protein
MTRIHFYLRAASDAAAAGDLPAAIQAAELVGEFIQRDLITAFKAEKKRRDHLEQKSG